MMNNNDLNLDFDSPIFEYLDDLRESGVVNMFGAGPYLQEQFGLDRHTAKRYVLAWMETFGQRHGRDQKEDASCG